MLVNKIRCQEDVEIFTQLPKEKMDGILRDTPAYLLEVMAKLARALFYNMDIPEDKTEEAVAKIKERRMGRLFEGITFDYQAEMRKMREAREEAQREIEAAQQRAQQEIEEAEQKIEEAEQKIEEAQQRAQRDIESAKKEMELAERIEAEAQKKSEEAEKRSEEARKKVEKANQEIKILRYLLRMSAGHHTVSEIKESLKKEFGLSEEEAATVWEECGNQIR